MNDDSADFAHRSSEASSALVLLSLPVSPKTPNSSESTLVWVIVGKTQHPAWLLEEDSSLPSSSRSLVRWTSTGKSEWVDSTTVHTELPCRQTKRRVSYVETKDENDDDVLAAATTTTTKPTGFAKLFPLAPTPSAPPPAVEKSGQGRKKRARSEPTDSTPATKMQNVTTSDAKMALIFKIADVKSTRFGTGVAVHVGRDESFEADGNLVEQNRNDSGEDVPLIEFGKQSTGNSNDDDDDDQDDSVEFICTMRPLSSSTNPTRSVSRSPPQFPSIEANVTAFDEANDQGAKPAMCAMSPFLNDRVTGSSATSTLPLPDACPRKIEKPDTAMEPDKNKSQGSSSLFRSSSTREDPYDNVDASQQAALSESIQVDVKNVFSAKEYALRTSAYLQNLAEISYTVLWDVRWRVSGANALPLFQWEKGDDLSAMIALSRCYEPMPTSTKYKCTCLLCHDEQGDCFHAALPNRTNAEESIGNVSATVDLIASMSVLPGDRETAQGTVKQSQFSPPSAVDTLQDQSMYLYSRLFYRKGPWFRLDDIYNKYYVSSAKKSFLNRQRPPMESTIHATESRKPSSTSSVLDKILLAYHLDHILPSLFDSVELLYSSGMIRFFQDETECGKTVGKSLLHSDERQFLLTKLGAKKKAGRARDGNSLRENEVWKQMSQPKLFFPSQPNGKRSSVLPARIHVESIFLEKLAKSITVACCRNDNIPAHEMRKLTSTTMKSIQDLIGERYKAFFTRHFGMCFRLREEPTQTLQRCVRLYLCALAGPGDMRGNGTNGWRSVKPITVANVAFEGIVQPPGQQNWFQVEHPGLSVRLGLSSACFFEAYRPLPVNDLINLQCGHQSEQVFCSRDSFLRWELCVELRANVDYLVELNEALRSEARREALGKKSRYGKGYLIASSGSVDLLSLLTFDGRQAVLCKLLEGDENLANVIVEVENDISASNPDLQGECEKVLGVIGVIAMQVLCLVNLSLVDGHDRELKERSWLRHMHWQACMAYFLFDIIPILERRALYRLSVKCLEVLLFGRFTKTSKTTSTHYEELFQPNDNAPLMSALLSRRARGKVADRLIIDCVHLHRALVGALESITKRSAVKCFQTRLTSFCRKLIESVAVSGTMGFSMIRLMARRLKQPLSETLQDVICLESIELGLRYDNRANDANGRSKKYSDWSPVTDRFVANTLANDSMEAGARCSFVGFEDEIESSLCSSSLNVEELAMELYRTGRLPANCELRPLQGGWVGWHDEGSRMRSLFRIMCGAPILGMDFGCAYENLGVREQQEQNTIHLSPYQQAPFDLHVGYEVKGEVGDNCISARGFYKRRSTVIGNFISKLEHSSSQALSDIVFRSVKSRLIHSTTSTVKDPFLERDLMQVRTMSALAAGFGGKLLAASFRCLLFDYRHYSGGLPDLQLFRAVTMSDSTATRAQLVDLGDWIGESFSAESQLVAATARAAAFLSDRDEEYLGCSKFGDSGNQSQPNRDRKPRVSTPKTITIPLHAMPERLLLVHNNRTVQVECMMVEVKSSNDRLDPRQEDWLNILDCHGNARVCKFEDKKKDKNAATRSRVCP